MQAAPNDLFEWVGDAKWSSNTEIQAVTNT